MAKLLLKQTLITIYINSTEMSVISKLISFGFFFGGGGQIKNGFAFNF